MKLTIVYHFFNNSDAIKSRILELLSMNQIIKDKIQVVVVDDASDFACSFGDLGLNKMNSIYARINTKINWNQGGARNLAGMLATGDWLLFLDVDHKIMPEGISYLLSKISDSNDVFYFNRTDGSSILKKAPNIFAMSRNKFISLGGYDEDFSGGYGFEDILFHDMRARVLNIRLIKYPFIFVDKAQGTKGLSRDTSRNESIYLKKKDLINSSSYEHPPILNFQFTLVDYSNA